MAPMEWLTELGRNCCDARFLANMRSCSACNVCFFNSSKRFDWRNSSLRNLSSLIMSALDLPETIGDAMEDLDKRGGDFFRIDLLVVLSS